jgi:hypothetical protein
VTARQASGQPGGSPHAGSRPRARRAGLLAAAAAAALLATACGGRGSPPTAAGTSQQQVLKYSQCMRSHGLPGFPDPDSQGGLEITPQDHLNAGSRQFQSAQRACQHLEPGGTTKSLTAAQWREVTSQGLRFVACMRAHQVLAMPDPTIQTTTSALLGGSGQVMNFDLRRTGLSPDSPVLKSALRACQRLLSAGDVPISIQGAPGP